MKSYVVAVVGATGLVGTEMIQTLERRKFPVKKLLPLASEKSKGKQVRFNGQSIAVEVLNDDAFAGVDYALFSAGGSVSERFAASAVRHGAIVIDNTSFFRMHEDVPLVVPEVNAAALRDHNGIIANPNCSTAQLVVALKPIHDAAQITRVIISTYQAVSGAGKLAMEGLEAETKCYVAGEKSMPQAFPYPIAFNLIPQIDKFQDNGYTKEEMKMVQETKKILGDSSILVTATCVRVPVLNSHSVSVTVETKKKLTVLECRTLLEKAPGLVVQDDPAKGVFPMPILASETDPVYVGRIREDLAFENGLSMWIVADNLRKGAALNAVQIAETMIQN
jgi:aspartate-semialdehyde dehydrogenase